MNYIQIDFGKPVDLAFKFATPLAVKSKTGAPLAMFTCTDGKKLYVPPMAGHEIAKLNLKPGEIFRLLKTKANSGACVWKATRPEQPAVRLLQTGPSLDSAIPDRAETPVRHETKNADIQSAKKPVTQLESALKTAVSAAAEAEKEAERLGYGIRFSSADVRAMAISVLISMGQNGGGRYAA
jgi:hypothetical protein